MTARASAWFETKYADGVTHALQHKGFILKSTVSQPDEIKGNTVNWRVVGSGEATPLSTAIEDVAVMNTDRTLITATMQDWEANDYVKKADLNKMSVSEQDKVMMSGAMAIGRRLDRIIMETLDAAAGTISNIGTGAAAITPLDMFNAQSQLFDEGGAGYEMYCVIPSYFMAHLLTYREFTSADWVGDEYPLLKALGARRHMGITYIPLPGSTSNANKRFFNIPAANQMDGYIWVSHAIGMAYSDRPNSRADWVAEKKSWLIANDVSACAAVLLPEGVRRLRFSTSAALARPTP